MKLIVTGAKTSQLFEVERAAKWYLERYIKDDEVEVGIELTRKTKYHGMCFPCDVIERKNNYKRFLITIHRKFYYHYSLQVLFHELQHLNQFNSGRLCYGDYVDQSMVIWEGAHMEWNVDYKSIKEYENDPWEIEARSKELPLLNEYYEHLGFSL